MECGRQPIVLIQPRMDMPQPMVDIDDQAGVKVAVAYLQKLGHRDVLWFDYPLRAFPTPADRKQNFLSAAEEARMHGTCYHLPTWNSDVNDEEMEPVIEAAMSQRLAEGRRFTAVFCYNDRLAVGAMRALRRSGLRVPEDVSVIGFDDLYGSMVIPTLTSVDTKMFDMGRAAGRMALELVMGEPEVFERLRGKREVLLPELRVRESTGPAKPLNPAS